jgi:hypothetical protein
VVVGLDILVSMSSPRTVIGDPQIKEYGFPIKALGNDRKETALVLSSELVELSKDCFFVSRQRK